MNQLRALSKGPTNMNNESTCYKGKKLITFDDEEISCFCRECSTELIGGL